MPSGGNNTTTQTNLPPNYVIPYLTGDVKKGIPGVLPTAQAQFESSKPAFYPDSTVSGFSPDQLLAIQRGTARATSGSPLTAAASGYVTDTLSGKYLGADNPYLAAIQDRGMVDASKAAGAFTSAGRTGSGAAQGSIAEAYTNAVAPYQYNTYNTERAAMTDAAHLAPTLAAQDYTDLNALSTIGGVQQQQSQAELQSNIDRWNFGQTIDAQKLQQYADLIRGTSSGYGTTTGTTPSPGIGQSILGALFGVGSMFANPSKPWFLA